MYQGLSGYKTFKCNEYNITSTNEFIFIWAQFSWISQNKLISHQIMKFINNRSKFHKIKSHSWTMHLNLDDCTVLYSLYVISDRAAEFAVPGLSIVGPCSRPRLHPQSSPGGIRYLGAEDRI